MSAGKYFDSASIGRWKMAPYQHQRLIKCGDDSFRPSKFKMKMKVIGL